MGGPPTPPPGFAGPAADGPGPAPVVNPYAVPVPAASPAAPPKQKGGSGRFVIALVVLVAVGAGAFWFVSRSGDDQDDAGSKVAADGPGAAILLWADAMADHDYEAACAAMATAAVEKLEATGATCAAEMERLSPDGLYDEAGDSKVLDEEIDGDRARVTLKLGGSLLPQQPMAATLEDGTWKADPFSFGVDVGKPGDQGADDGTDEGAAPAGEATTTTAPPVTTTVPAGPTTTAAWMAGLDAGDVLQAWFTAVWANDFAEACVFASAETVQKAASSGKTCEAAMQENFDKKAPPMGAIAIASEAYQGNQATVGYTIGGGAPQKTTLLFENDGWKVTLLG